MNNRMRINGIVAAILCVAVLFAGCGMQKETDVQNHVDQNVQEEKEQASSHEVSLKLSLEDYPRIDGSTANLPLMAEILSEVCGIPMEEAQDYVSCSKTSQAWLNLANGDMDLLLVYEPDEATKDLLGQMGTELEITAIGRDGLVFINNENNPVNRITSEQLRGIYTGNITNWQQLGGEDLTIEAYQRKETSGSQAMFRKLVMGELTPVDAPSEYRPSEMGELIDVLAEYNDSASAIGYSVFYYVSEMYAHDGLRLMEVDGVMPSAETIRDGSYPFTNDFFAVIRADEPDDSTARQLYNWIGSEEGETALLQAGYAPAGDDKRSFLWQNGMMVPVSQ